jgi:CelD/BcsL family acetyltransferase involved in cellulose biosynthesis
MTVATAAKFNAYDEALPKVPFAEARPRVAGQASGVIDLAIYENLADIEAEWRAFERYADCTAFQTFDWLSTWQTHIGALDGVTPAVVVGRRGDGAIAVILPLAVQQAGGARALSWLGSDLNDCNAPLFASDFAAHLDAMAFAELWQRIIQLLSDNARLRFDFVSLEKMPSLIGGYANPMLALGVTLHPSGYYVTQLSGGWEAYYTAKRSSATRRRDRTKRKKLGEFGEVRMVHPQGPNDILATLDTLMAQKSRSFARMGVANLFARPGHAEFYRALAAGPNSNDFVHVSRLDCGEQVAAANLGLAFRGVYYHLLASHTDSELSRFGPGAAHLNELLAHAIDRGCKAFDFTIGDEPYKLDWCDTGDKLYDHLAAANARGTLAVTLMSIKQRLKRGIKQTPALWKAYTKVRALAGAIRRRS